MLISLTCLKFEHVVEITRRRCLFEEAGFHSSRLEVRCFFLTFFSVECWCVWGERDCTHRASISKGCLIVFQDDMWWGLFRFQDVRYVIGLQYRAKFFSHIFFYRYILERHSRSWLIRSCLSTSYQPSAELGVRDFTFTSPASGKSLFSTRTIRIFMRLA